MSIYTVVTENYPAQNITASGPGEAIQDYVAGKNITLVGTKRRVEYPILHWEWDRANGLPVHAVPMG